MVLNKHTALSKRSPPRMALRCSDNGAEQAHSAEQALPPKNGTQVLGQWSGAEQAHGAEQALPPKNGTQVLREWC